jgi:hypothetical protein
MKIGPQLKNNCGLTQCNAHASLTADYRIVKTCNSGELGFDYGFFEPARVGIS